MALNDGDFFLVNDGSVTEKVTWEQINDSVKPPLSVSVSILPAQPTVGTEVKAIAVGIGGTPDYTYSDYQWHTADDKDGTNQVDIAGATSDTYTPVNADEGKFLGCSVKVTDSASKEAEGTGYAPTAVEVDVEIAKPTVIYPPDGAGCLLYTSPSPRDAHESRMPSSA